MRNLFRMLCVLIMAGGVSTAMAATTTTTFAVTASVINSCSMGSVSTLAFGTYDPTGGASTSGTTTITVTCTLLTPYNIGLNAGTTVGGTVAQRQMQGATPANKLNYNLYTTGSHSTVWGNTIGTNTVAAAGLGLPVNHTVHGLISAGTSASVDTYTDTITVTLTY